MLTNLFVFVAALGLVIKGSTMATTYADRFAESLGISKYAVGFMVVAIISILPETFIAINSALNGVSAFGLGMLFGSNIADLTLVFALMVFYAGRSLKVESKVLRNQALYPFILILPLLLGLDGQYTRVEGAALIVMGLLFYHSTLQHAKTLTSVTPPSRRTHYQSLFLLVGSTALMVVGAHFTVTSATAIARALDVSPVLIGLLVVGLGTTMPELFFGLRSVRTKEDGLAVGDMLGTVLADATVVVGILALIQPFTFPQQIVYITGAFMVVAAFVLFQFMRSGRSISRREALLLLAFWLVFVLVEFVAATA
ncbi:MAG: sodium:calcium antiporter [Candidatus Paceibacterota bacterium]